MAGKVTFWINGTLTVKYTVLSIDLCVLHITIFYCGVVVFYKHLLKILQKSKCFISENIQPRLQFYLQVSFTNQG